MGSLPGVGAITDHDGQTKQAKHTGYNGGEKQMGRFEIDRDLGKLTHGYLPESKHNGPGQKPGRDLSFT